MNKPNLAKLRAEYNAAERAWRNAAEARGLSIYDDAAEGQLVGRGKAKQPDELRKLFDAREAAREAYFSHGEE